MTNSLFEYRGCETEGRILVGAEHPFPGTDEGPCNTRGTRKSHTIRMFGSKEITLHVKVVEDDGHCLPPLVYVFEPPQVVLSVKFAPSSLNR